MEESRVQVGSDAGLASGTMGARSDAKFRR